MATFLSSALFIAFCIILANNADHYIIAFSHFQLFLLLEPQLRHHRRPQRRHPAHLGQRQPRGEPDGPGQGLQEDHLLRRASLRRTGGTLSQRRSLQAILPHVRLQVSQGLHGTVLREVTRRRGTEWTPRSGGFRRKHLPVVYEQGQQIVSGGKKKRD